jgi:hypothetical protein
VAVSGLPPRPADADDPTVPDSGDRRSRILERHRLRRRTFIIAAATLVILIAAGGAAIAVARLRDHSAVAPPRTTDPTSGGQSPTTETTAKLGVSPPPTSPPPTTPADPFSDPATISYLAGRQGSITAAVYNVKTGQTFLYRPGVTEQTASIVKVDILATLLWQLEQASQPLSSEQNELATGMIEQSDNDDATALWNNDGAAPGVAHFDSMIGMDETTPNYHWGETTTSAMDQVHLLKLVVFPNQVLGPASRAYELNLMENVVGWEHWGVSSGPPATVTVALKNGWLPITNNDWQINSIGYVNGSGRQYLIAVLTTENSTENYGISSIQGLSSLIWSELAPSG